MIFIFYFDIVELYNQHIIDYLLLLLLNRNRNIYKYNFVKQFNIIKYLKWPQLNFILNKSGNCKEDLMFHLYIHIKWAPLLFSGLRYYLVGQVVIWWAPLLFSGFRYYLVGSVII